MALLRSWMLVPGDRRRMIDKSLGLAVAVMLDIEDGGAPTAQEIDYCRRVLHAFEEARARGGGAIAFGGQLLDLPIVERARQTVALADAV